MSDLRDTFNLACPNCGQAETLEIDISVLAIVTASGSEPHGDHEWSDNSSCHCPDCRHHGTVADFKPTSKLMLARVRIQRVIDSCNEALAHEWDRSDDGFTAMLDDLNEALQFLAAEGGAR